MKQNGIRSPVLRFTSLRFGLLLAECFCKLVFGNLHLRSCEDDSGVSFLFLERGRVNDRATNSIRKQLTCFFFSELLN